jgi:5,5'-dehydrodivanillate O-demethylase
LADAAELAVDRLFWRVPVDDQNCVSFVVDFLPLTGDAARQYRKRRQKARQEMRVSPNELAEAILAGKLRVEEIELRIPIYYLFWIEDYVVQVGQGPFAPRAADHLGKVDQGVFLLRKIWERELKAVAEGRPLKEWKGRGRLLRESDNAPSLP